MDYFGNKSSKIAKRWGLAKPSAKRWGFRPQTPVQVKWLENVQEPTPIKITDWCRCLAYFEDLLHLIENMFDRKRIYANPSATANPNSNPNTNPNPNPEAQLCFRTDEMTSFFDQE